jgi:PBP1b-binding outer membrane lipoprotein LpoB
MKHLVMTSVLAILLAGCASTETVKEAQGQGISRTYEYAYEPVFNAAVAAAKAKELEVLENDKNAGRLVFSKGVTLWSWGERIAVFVRPVNSKTTQVEVVSKAVMAPLNFPPDWQNILLEQIASELKTGKY